MRAASTRSTSRRGTGEDARRSILACVLVIVMLCTGVISQESSTEYTFRSKTELVLVNVTVRDKNGNPVRDLKREDFTLLEDNKPQQVLSFDLENTDAVLSTAATEARIASPDPSQAHRATLIRARHPALERPAAHHPVLRSQLHATG